MGSTNDAPLVYYPEVSRTRFGVLRAFRQFFELDKVIDEDVRLHHYFCPICREYLASQISKRTNEKNMIDRQLIAEPAVRVVLGIEPEKRIALEERFDINLSIGWGMTVFFCRSCSRDMIKRIAIAAPFHMEEITAWSWKLKMESYDTNKGCWITVTEFPCDGKAGQFLNFQTDYRNFIGILDATSILPPDTLGPYIKALNGKA